MTPVRKTGTTTMGNGGSRRTAQLAAKRGYGNNTTGGAAQAARATASERTAARLAAHDARIAKLEAQLAQLRAQREQIARGEKVGTATKAPRPPKADLGPAPVPLAGAGARFNPYGKYDPYQLREAYGRDQLRAVLMRATQKRLREAVDIVQTREPTSAPKSKARNADMIDYIVGHVAGPDY